MIDLHYTKYSKPFLIIQQSSPAETAIIDYSSVYQYDYSNFTISIHFSANLTSQATSLCCLFNSKRTVSTEKFSSN